MSSKLDNCSWSSVSAQALQFWPMYGQTKDLNLEKGQSHPTWMDLRQITADPKWRSQKKRRWQWQLHQKKKKKRADTNNKRAWLDSDITVLTDQSRILPNPIARFGHWLTLVILGTKKTRQVLVIQKTCKSVWALLDKKKCIQCTNLWFPCILTMDLL